MGPSLFSYDLMQGLFTRCMGICLCLLLLPGVCMGEVGEIGEKGEVGEVERVVEEWSLDATLAGRLEKFKH